MAQARAEKLAHPVSRFGVKLIEEQRRGVTSTRPIPGGPPKTNPATGGCRVSYVTGGSTNALGGGLTVSPNSRPNVRAGMVNLAQISNGKRETNLARQKAAQLQKPAEQLG
jgi:hypothetical protein